MSKTQNQTICPYCGKATDWQTYCPDCRKYFSPDSIAAGGKAEERATSTSTGQFCPNCRNIVEPNSSFCRHCGLNLTVEDSVMQNSPPSQPSYSDIFNATPGSTPPSQHIASYNITSSTRPSVEISNENMSGKSSTGLKPNIAAALSYALIWITGFLSNTIISLIVIGQMLPGFSSGRYNSENAEILVKLVFAGLISQIISLGIACGVGFMFFLMERESRFVRLHTIQAILFNVLNVATIIVIGVVGGVIGVMDLALGGVASVLGHLVLLAFLVIWIILMVKAYKGERLKLPVINNIAENIVSK